MEGCSAYLLNANVFDLDGVSLNPTKSKRLLESEVLRNYSRLMILRELLLSFIEVDYYY
jgi:hypothetical protein